MKEIDKKFLKAKLEDFIISFKRSEGYNDREPFDTFDRFNTFDRIDLHLEEILRDLT